MADTKDGAWLNDAKIAAAKDAAGNTLPVKCEADGSLAVVINSTAAPIDVLVDNIVPVSQSGTWTVNLAAEPVIDIGTVDQGIGGSSAWKVDGSAVTQPVSGNISVLNFPATQPISGTVAVSSVGGSVAVTGPLTDTQLRLTPVPVSGTFWQTTQPVSGTFFQAIQPVSGTVTADAGSGTFLVDGSGHTQPISGTVAATQGTSPWVTSLASTTITGNVTVAQGTGTNLHVVVDSAPTTSVTGSGNFTVVQGTGTNLHAVLDATSTTAVTQATGSNLHTVLDSGTLTSITNALPTGSNVIGHIIADTGSTTAVTGNVTVVQGTGSNLHVVVDTAPTTAVTGPLTDTQLRASAVPVSLATAPTTTVIQPTGTNLHVVVDSAPSTTVTGSVSVSNFPATQTISGAITEANVDKNFGTWAYYAGTSGTVNVTGGQRVLGIGAHATTAGSLTINGGSSVAIPAGVSFNLSPLGNITAPTIVFTGTDSYFIEVVS